MTETIDTDLFLRLMRLSAPARTDLLEYIGQGPLASAPAWTALSCHCDGTSKPKRPDGTGPTPRPRP